MIMVGLMAIVLFAICGLAIDVGRIFITKAELSRDVDAAALAGVQDLPNVTDAIDRAAAYMAANDPGAIPEAAADCGDNCLRVRGSKTVSMYFLSLLGFGDVEVNAQAKAGFGIGASAKVDIVLVMDDTGTMKSGCNASQDNDDCPIKQARNGAKALLDILPLSCAGCKTQVAVVSFRGCQSNNNNRYNPISGEAANRGCIIQDDIMNLSSDRTALENHIDTLSAPGGFPGTNICVGMYEGYSRLTGAGAQAGAAKIMIVLTDGDNRYSDTAQRDTRNKSSSGNPVPGVYPTGTYSSNQGGSHTCRPTGPNQDSTNYGNDYDEIIKNLDVGTNNYATTLKDTNNVEIYVLRFAIPADDDDISSCDTSLVSSTSWSVNREGGSEIRDQNIARCIASDPLNEHYFFAATPEEIPVAFGEIAASIALRLLE